MPICPRFFILHRLARSRLIIGVNTFLNPKGMARQEIELARSSEEEKQS